MKKNAKVTIVNGDWGIMNGIGYREVVYADDSGLRGVVTVSKDFHVPPVGNKIKLKELQQAQNQFRELIKKG